jgi:hypothetical protein
MWIAYLLGIIIGYVVAGTSAEKEWLSWLMMGFGLLIAIGIDHSTRKEN